MINTKARKRPVPPPAAPAQSTMFHELDGELRIAHELFRRGLKASFLDGLTTPAMRRARLREELMPIADSKALSLPGVTMRQLFERTYREPLEAPTSP